MKNFKNLIIENQIAKFIFEHCDIEKSKAYYKYFRRVADMEKLNFLDVETMFRKELPRNPEILDLLSNLEKETPYEYENCYIARIGFFLMCKIYKKPPIVQSIYGLYIITDESYEMYKKI